MQPFGIQTDEAPSATRASGPVAIGGGHLRTLDDIADFRACVALQEATWGRDGETVHASLLTVAAHIGGLVVGAFDAHNALVGFVFGLPGADADGPLHWSHMLAVLGEVRGAGIGRLLKEYQRAELARRGVTRIFWTFDPLQARNAHLNVTRLGARIVSYVDNLYGVTASPLHLGIATDRVIAMTDAASQPLPHHDLGIREHEPVRSVGSVGARGVAPSALELGAPAVLVEIPADIQDIVNTDTALAGQWRLATRAHFHSLLDSGYAVTGFVRDETAQRAFYRFTR